ncbi:MULTISPECIES: type II toxin-antitoxin system RelE/ParE family toxin [unclassified Alishewanella]|uniref:type II toxin-antitoxin system RelE/ParE family toxin n=1 Tax=unclassified Alishewanella TaxID=2628974 RepID=UPI004042B051
MVSYKLSSFAESDIKEIAAKTIDAWGKQQARLYAENLHNTMLMLANNPALGRMRDDIFAGTRSFPSGKHVIFYKPCKGGIDVARVLHQRMDILSQLDE